MTLTIEYSQDTERKKKLFQFSAEKNQRNGITISLMPDNKLPFYIFLDVYIICDIMGRIYKKNS